MSASTRVEKKSFFQKKKTHLFFVCFSFKSVFCCFFLKKKDFVFLLRKTETPHSELFLLHHAISLFSESYNNDLLYLLYGIQN